MTAVAPSGTAPPGESRGTDGGGRTIDRQLALMAVGVMVAAGVVVARLGWDVLRLDFFFDEMWRVDFIRSSDTVDRMLTLDTPLPIGWVFFMKAALLPLPDAFGSFRLVSMACLVAFAGVTFLTLARIGRRTPSIGGGTPVPVLVAAAAALAVLMSQGLGIQIANFSNYPFEVLWFSVMVLATLELENDRRAWLLLLGLTAVSPWFVFGPLLALPALLFRALLWARGQGPRAGRRLTELGVAVGGMALSGLAAYALLYGRVTEEGTVADFWAGQSLAGGLGDLPGRLPDAWRQLGHDVIHPQVFAGGFRTVAGVLAVAAFAFGAWELGRRWPWYPATLVCGLLLTVPAGLVFGWPVTPVRVNLAFVVMIYTMTAFGLFRAVQGALALILGASARWPAALASLVLLVVLWPPPRVVFPDVFARGLAADLQPVADSPAQENLVLSYHFMSHFYAHDTLVNTDRDGREYDIVREDREDPFIYDEVDTLVAERLEPGGVLWCIRPYAMGPEAAERACRFDDPDLVEIHRSRGTQAVITGYRLGP